MINFISLANSYCQFGRLLTVSELINRRWKSQDGTLTLWGYLIISKQIPYKVSIIPNSVVLTSDKDIRDFVIKKPGVIYKRFIAFTRREKLESFSKAAICFTDVPGFVSDKSTYFTEVYD